MWSQGGFRKNYYNESQWRWWNSAELFLILTIMLLKCCIQYTSKFGKLSRGHRTGKDQFSFQSQRKAMPKNVQTTAQLYSFHMLWRRYSKILQARLKQYLDWELPGVLAGFRKVIGTRDQIARIRWIIEKARESQKHIYFCFIDYAKAFYCGSQQTVENSSRDGNTRPLCLPPEKPVCRLGSNS